MSNPYSRHRGAFDIDDARLAYQQARQAQADKTPTAVCECCGAHVPEIIGAPDGREVCPACFDQGAA